MTAAATTPEEASTSSRSAVESLLGSLIKCTLSDGRIATGQLICIDRMKNIILGDCVEERWISADDYNPDAPQGETTPRKVVIRRLQQAMVPGTQLRKVQIASNVYQSKILPHMEQKGNTS